MMMGDHLRFLREQMDLSQGDIQKRTGLLRCYISRVENNHTTPSVETLQKMALAMDIQLHQVLYDGPRPPELPKLVPENEDSIPDTWGARGNEARSLSKLRRFLAQMTPRNRTILTTLISQLSKQKTRRNLK
ncbi:MAG: hypothetical protein QOH96_2041 [Blastocatellia bacterium]|jgi:transcriptional regulator with XRE-family HTH domain|nr:hypothetical protein [Blastocatellia bacterium]